VPMVAPSRRTFAPDGVEVTDRVVTTGFLVRLAVTVFVLPAGTVKEVL